MSIDHVVQKPVPHSDGAAVEQRATGRCSSTGRSLGGRRNARHTVRISSRSETDDVHRRWPSKPRRAKWHAGVGRPWCCRAKKRSSVARRLAEEHGGLSSGRCLHLGSLVQQASWARPRRDRTKFRGSRRLAAFETCRSRSSTQVSSDSFAKAMALSKMKPRGDRDDIYRKMVAEQTVAYLKLANWRFVKEPPLPAHPIGRSKGVGGASSFPTADRFRAIATEKNWPPNPVRRRPDYRARRVGLEGNTGPPLSDVFG